MKVIKNINNNVSLCIDDNGNELVAFGPGIGFHKPPYEITDMSAIQRTYYDIDRKYLGLIDQLSSEILELSAQVIDYARSRLDTLFNSNIVFTLADHLAFAVERMESNTVLSFSMSYDLENLYSIEVDIGRYALRLLNSQLKIHLPRQEIYGIALHIINAEHTYNPANKKNVSRQVIQTICHIIEEHFYITLDQTDFNYSRFVSHMEYLLERGEQGLFIESENVSLLADLKKEFPDMYSCAEQIGDFLSKKFSWHLNDEELLYLVLHINRLCARAEN